MILQLLSITCSLFVNSAIPLTPKFNKLENCTRTAYENLQCENSIPNEISYEIKKVTIGHFSQDVILTTSTFNGSGWQHITELIINNPSRKDFQNTGVEFTSLCFKHLVHLKTLRIHVVKNLYYSDCLAGLTSLEVLDLSNSTNLGNDALRLIFAPGMIPNLKILLMRETGVRYSGYIVDDYFGHMITTRPITYIDLSFVHITSLNLTSVLARCGEIETAILRNVVVGLKLHFDTISQPCKNLKRIDLSGAVIPGFYFCFIQRLDDVHNITFKLRDTNSIAYFETAILDNMCPRSTTKHIFSNISGIRLVAEKEFRIRTLSMRSNNLVYLDVEINWENPVLESLSLADNNMEFINPRVLASIYTLKHLDLSDNLLGLMSWRNKTYFIGLLKSLYNLLNVSLARNKLSYLPNDFFDNNTLLQSIDLAGNSLLQVDFVVRVPNVLRFLDLSGNNIQSLDSYSQKYLSVILQNRNSSVAFQGNPFTCYKCGDLTTVSWLHKQSLQQFTAYNCTDENNKSIFIRKQTTNNLQAICDKPKRIAVWSSIGIGIVLAMAILAVVLNKVYTRRRKNGDLKRVIQMIKEKQNGYEFAVFLSFSSANYSVAQNHIVPQLQWGLQVLIGEERDMVCLADVHFRIGVSIHQETYRHLQKSHAVLFIITDEFCLSEFCTFEFQQAYQLKKRIILMIEENTNEELMPTELKTIFKQNTRIIWRDLDGECILKTSWENVCRSILEI